MKLLLLTLCSSLIFYGCDQKTESGDAPAQRSLSSSRIIDLTYDLSDETVFWVTAKEFQLETVAAGHTEKGYYYAANNFCMAEHGGTHIDAPIHFAENGQTVDEVPLEQLVGAGIKIDVSQNAINEPDYLVSVEDLKDWEAHQSSNSQLQHQLTICHPLLH